MCEQTPSTTLPSRLIDVGSDEKDPVIVESHETGVQYATLSHCWDRIRPMTTATSTLEDRMRCISLELLPKTFRDAVLLTRKFHLKYLWIDSLCIIFDRDALPALSGLANLIQPVILDTYLAGLWREVLHQQLLWCKARSPIPLDADNFALLRSLPSERISQTFVPYRSRRNTEFCRRPGPELLLEGRSLTTVCGLRRVSSEVSQMSSKRTVNPPLRIRLELSPLGISNFPYPWPPCDLGSMKKVRKPCSNDVGWGSTRAGNTWQITEETTSTMKIASYGTWMNGRYWICHWKLTIYPLKEQSSGCYE